MPEPMWTPSPGRVAGTNLTAFMKAVEADWGVACRDYAALHRWSVAEMAKFWATVWRFCGVIGELNDTPVVVDADRMPGARFFPEAWNRCRTM